MDLLQILSSLFGNNKNLSTLIQLFELLRKNNFDIKSALSSLNFSNISDFVPLIKELMFSFNNKSSAECAEQDFGLSPISNIADKEIIYSLNKFFATSC